MICCSNNVLTFGGGMVITRTNRISRNVNGCSFLLESSKPDMIYMRMVLYKFMIFHLVGGFNPFGIY